MTVNRGDIVLVDYPFTAGGAKVRPALVIQNDPDNMRMTNTIVAQISGNTARFNEATQHLIDVAAEPVCPRRPGRRRGRPPPRSWRAFAPGHRRRRLTR
jgi:PemK-like, MazF-like toxin of type II toxin-antitoxin system